MGLKVHVIDIKFPRDDGSTMTVWYPVYVLKFNSNIIKINSTEKLGYVIYDMLEPLLGDVTKIYDDGDVRIYLITYDVNNDFIVVKECVKIEHEEYYRYTERHYLVPNKYRNICLGMAHLVVKNCDVIISNCVKYLTRK